MKITKIIIHNFRSILHQELDLCEFALLVGSNNAGKTTVIDCIRAFYEKDKYLYKHDRDFPKINTADSESWVEITYSLTADEYAGLKDDYKLPNQNLCVRKYFETKNVLKDGKTAKGVFLAYKQNGELCDEPFYGAANVQKGKLGNVIYIPAANKVDDFTKLSGPSALRDLLTAILEEVVEGSSSYANLALSVEQFASQIRDAKTKDDRSLGGFESDLNEELRPWNAKFKLDFKTPNTSEIIKSMIAWDIVDEIIQQPQNIESYGSGFQRHFIFSVIKLGGSYSTAKVQVAKDFTPKLNLLLFEEPEAFLHPPQQLSLADDLRKLAQKETWQVLSTTHSPHFVSRSMAELCAIIHLVKENSEVNAYQLSQTVLESISDLNKMIGEIAKKWPKLAKTMNEADLKQEMDSLRYFMFFNPDRAGAFFSDRVLLVEGPSEVGLINKLSDAELLKLPYGTYVMDSLGKYNIHRFMNLFAAMGIRHSVLFDDDNDKEHHAELNELIDVSRNPFTVSIQRIARDLEAFLGIPSAKQSNKKPQHVLYLLETAQIPQEKLKAFIDLISNMLN